MSCVKLINYVILWFGELDFVTNNYLSRGNDFVNHGTRKIPPHPFHMICLATRLIRPVCPRQVNSDFVYIRQRIVSA